MTGKGEECWLGVCLRLLYKSSMRHHPLSLSGWRRFLTLLSTTEAAIAWLIPRDWLVTTFFAMDFSENTILLGNDGPSNIGVA